MLLCKDSVTYIDSCTLKSVVGSGNIWMYTQTRTVQQSIAQTNTDPFFPGNGNGSAPDAMALGLDLCLTKWRPVFRN